MKSNSSASPTCSAPCAAVNRSRSAAARSRSISMASSVQSLRPSSRAVSAPRPGPISTRCSPAARVERRHDAVDDGRVVQEVLAEALAPRRPAGRGGACHQCRWRARRLASCTAAARLAGSARPVPARSSAVPWSGEVRSSGRPSVTLTVRSKPACLITGRPWSWYMASTASKPAQHLRHERGVGRQRAAGVDAGAAQPRDGRRDHVELLAPEMAAFAGVRVEAAHRQARRGDAEAARELARQDGGGLAQRVDGQRGAHVLERQVRGGECDAQLVGDEQHHGTRRRRSAAPGTRCGR